MNWKKTLFLSLGILLTAAAILVVIFSTEPKADRINATKRTAMLVDVITVERGTYTPQIRAMGTVVPEQEIELSPRVSGEILSVSQAFTPGGYVNRGDLLVEIDPADYEAALLQRESELHQAEAELQLEQGRVDVAKKDYELLGDQVTPDNSALVLREPQLKSAVAQVEAAQAAVRRATLDLERTRIRAPFNAHIIDRHANTGSLVSPGQPLGTLIGVDAYWVEVSIPLSKLEWIDFPENGDQQGAAAEVRSRAAWPEGVYRKGHVHRLIGSLESRTRLARVLVTIPDPLARLPENAGQPPLIVGSFMETRIQAAPLENVIRLHRDYLRSNNTTWVKVDGKLQIRDLDIIFSDETYAYIRSGLESGEAVVTTNLATVVEGANLRLEGEAE